MLRVSGVSKHFGGIAALENVRLDVDRGKITGIIGPNGSGKTTLLNVIGGLLRPNAGAVTLDGADITGFPVHERARRGLTRTFRISRELGALSVLENLLVARLRQTGESIWKALARFAVVQREEKEAISRAAAILQRVGLWKLADDPARSLSGGQKKLLELCRALMLDPKIILLDEPAAGVSPPMRMEIAQLIRSLRSEGMTFVIVEHDMEMVAGLCDQVYVFAAGTNLTSGSFQDVVSDRRVVEAYLGGMLWSPALHADGIVAGYGGAEIVKNVSAVVEPGQIFGVIGPNGSGKSTFIKALAGLIATRRGEIRLCGNPIAHLTPSERVTAGIAYVPQEFNVFPNLTIGENLRVSSEFLGPRRASPEQRERVLAMFPEVANRLKLRAGHLSGGQRQMLAFACAMMANPTVLLLDEPSAGLSPKLVGAIFERVKAANAAGLTIVLVEQNVKEAFGIVDLVMVLVSGTVRLLATPSEIRAKHDLHRLYLG